MSDDEDQSVQIERTHRGKEKAKRKRPPMKKRSAVWNHFTLLEDNPNKCMCNYCGKQYQYHSRLDGITNMTRHIKTCESYKTFRAQQSRSQQNLKSEGGEENASNLVLGKGWSQDACRRAVTKMIIMGELLFSFVDNKGFRHFCSVVIPQFVMPSRRTIGRDVMELFLEEKTMLKSFICNNKQRVSLTTNLWTSVQNMSYMVITTHFIDSDWCLNRRIISFSAIEDHRGKSIGLRELHASVTAIRNAVKYVRSSSMRLRTFKQCAEQVNCPKGIFVLDCPTRWNSTYLMLMTTLKFQTAFDRMAEVDKPYEAYFAEKENNVRRVGSPGPDVWESAERIVKFLKVFYDATLLFSASLSVTSNLCYDTIGLIESSLTALHESTDPWVSSMTYSIREKIDKYWEFTGKINKMLIIASILDPRAKIDFAKHIFEIIFGNDSLMVEQMTKAVKDLLNEFYDAYSAFSASSTPSMYGESGLSGSYGGTSSSQRFTIEDNLVDVAGDECDDAFQVSRLFFGYARKVSIQNESRRVVFEVERSLKNPVEDPSNLKLNVLLKWRVNESRYPILEKIARDVLVVPVSTVSKLFANLVYNLQEDINEQMFHMELQEELIRSQASTVEAVSADIGVMDV
ncbi:BED-type domain-containing protein [Citrus sinensis]|uniref:BED-type domain-containing protein n=1 Tax=Citrus sinensis TaxID=2711 RepID=A0ACB8NB78_CITSI|nr:BED-type domain-containing protein [Citrus sinensis]